MRRLRIAAVLTGLGALVTCGPARAFVLPDPVVEETPVAERSDAALALLESAATASQARAWTGTERVLSMVSGAPVESTVVVQHGPGRHSASDSLDARLFSLLASHYDLQVAGLGICDGRKARLVEVRRAGALAGRFWIDVASGLLLRREVLDADGALLRRSDLVAVRMDPPAPVGAATLLASSPPGERVDAAGLARFEEEGWPVVEALPGGLELYDARWHGDGVLQLAYSDGLSTLSLFVQRGELPPTTTGVVRYVGGGTVWQSPGEPERVVWAADGRTWTMVADVAPGLVDEVLEALPHTPSRVAEDGVAPRVWRGMSRVGAWLNPFH